MKTSEMISALATMIEKYGDLEIAVVENGKLTHLNIAIGVGGYGNRNEFIIFETTEDTELQ